MMKHFVIFLFVFLLGSLAFAAPDISPATVEDVKVATADTVEAVQLAAADGSDSLMAALEFQEGGFDWHKDWWKVTVMVLMVTLAMLVIIYTARVILKFLVMVICAMLALVAAFFLQQPVQPYIQDYAPDSLLKIVPLEYVTLFLLFVACFVFVSLFALAFINTWHSMQKVPKGKEDEE